MFKLNIEHSKNLKSPIFSQKHQSSFVNYEQGYHNIDSPMKAAWRLEKSPRKNLSPLKNNNYNRSGFNRAQSPILLSKREEQYSSNKKISPFKRIQFFKPQDEKYQQKSLSFTSLIRKNSGTTQNQNYNLSPFNKTLQYSKSNYLQSDRNYRQDTNLFKKLANMLQSNQPSRNFTNSEFSQNQSVRKNNMPQSCKNQYNNSNKKLFIKNVLTVQSIQSPQERDFIEDEMYEDDYNNIETKCYSEYEKMTSQYIRNDKKAVLFLNKEKVNLIPKIQKKDSKRYSIKQQKQEEMLSFKKITSVNQKNQNTTKQQISNPIDFHLNNSFGAVSIKNQIINEIQNGSNKMGINPFQQIQNQQKQIKQEIMQISKSLNESQDSVFASLKMFLDKVDHKQAATYVNKQNESINLSLMSQLQSSELDMEPYLQKRKR